MREITVFVANGYGYLGKPHWTVDPQTGCWVWQRAKDSLGYGRVGRGTYGESLAHRLVFQHYKGPIPKGLMLDHLCRNPSCVNPDHLEAVTQAMNNLRGLAVLTEDEVREVRLSQESHEALADRLAIGLNTVVYCRSGKSYGPLRADEQRAREQRQRRRPRKLSDADVREIRASDEIGRVLAKRYGVSVTRIRQVRNRRAYPDISG